MGSLFSGQMPINKLLTTTLGESSTAIGKPETEKYTKPCTYTHAYMQKIKKHIEET